MAFDAKAFMAQKVTAPMSTEREKVPEGQYRAMIDAGEGWIEFASGEIGKGERAGEQWVSANIRFLIQDEAVKAELGRDKVIVRKKIFLDLDKAGGLDVAKGRNVELGALREAVNQNNDKAWSIEKLEGAGPVMVEVTHRADPNDSSKSYVEVGKTARVS